MSDPFSFEQSEFFLDLTGTPDYPRDAMEFAPDHDWDWDSED